MMQLLHSYVWVLWDLLAVAIFFHFVQRCARRGFVSTIVRLLIYVVAAAVAAMAYLRLADFVYENVVHDVIQHALIRNFNEMLNEIGPTKDTIGAIPALLRMMIGFKSGEVAAMPVTDANVMAEQVIDMALKTPMMTLLHGAGFLLIFTITAYFMRYVSGLLAGINRVPVIGTLNTVLGGIAGVIEGVVMLFISGFVLRILIAISGEVWWWLNSTVIASTYIWRQFL